jgi:hypothetical protein
MPGFESCAIIDAGKGGPRGKWSRNAPVPGRDLIGIKLGHYYPSLPLDTRAIKDPAKGGKREYGNGSEATSGAPRQLPCATLTDTPNSTA